MNARARTYCRCRHRCWRCLAPSAVTWSARAVPAGAVSDHRGSLHRQHLRLRFVPSSLRVLALCLRACVRAWRSDVRAARDELRRAGGGGAVAREDRASGEQRRPHRAPRQPLLRRAAAGAERCGAAKLQVADAPRTTDEEVSIRVVSLGGLAAILVRLLLCDARCGAALTWCALVCRLACGHTRATRPCKGVRA
jgi:hypothetical protein